MNVAFMSIASMIFWSIWLGGAVVLGLIWLVRLILVGRGLRRRTVLSHESHTGGPASLPRVSLVVAARNEEANIERCLSSLLAQDYSDLQIIAVDDRSTDATPSILQKLSDQHPRLRVLTVQSLRDGWFGKNNAMREGVEVATGDWLCFTDADCRFTSPRTVTVAVREALSEDVDFLSVTPMLETETFWERVIQPVCGIVLIWWFLPERVNNPEKRTAYANGAFMLMRRSCYEAIGGHEAVKTEVNEDIRMARRTKRLGLKLRVVENDDLYRTRMYSTPSEAWRGWSRIFYGCFQTPKRLIRVASLHLIYSLIPWISLLVAIVGLASSVSENRVLWGWAVVAWAIAVVFQQLTVARIYPVTRHARGWSLLYFPGACICLAMMISAILKSVGASSTTWRGRTYRADRVIPEVSPAGNHEGAAPPTAKKSATHA